MQLIGKETVIRPCVATIGSFDGVHRGHRLVIQQTVSQARQRGLDAVVITFPNHPLQVLRPHFQPQMLSPTEEKVQMLQQTDIDKVALIPFTPELAQMPARTFMQTVLKEQLQVQVLILGYDNHFGSDRKGFADNIQYGKDLGIEVIQAAPLLDEQGGTADAGQPFSSTTIRQSLLVGDVATANRMLGYCYNLQGIVVKGFQNGRKLGYPTANLQVGANKLIPENGVYLVHTDHGFGMLNIGTRPTLHNGRQRSIEVHIFDFDTNLYGQNLRIELLHHLRKEQEFASLEALHRQLTADEQACRALAQMHTKH